MNKNTISTIIALGSLALSALELVAKAMEELKK